MSQSVSRSQCLEVGVDCMSRGQCQGVSDWKSVLINWVSRRQCHSQHQGVSDWKSVLINCVSRGQCHSQHQGVNVWKSVLNELVQAVGVTVSVKESVTGSRC